MEDEAPNRRYKHILFASDCKFADQTKINKCMPHDFNTGATVLLYENYCFVSHNPSSGSTHSSPNSGTFMRWSWNHRDKRHWALLCVDNDLSAAVKRKRLEFTEDNREIGYSTNNCTDLNIIPSEGCQIRCIGTPGKLLHIYEAIDFRISSV